MVVRLVLGSADRLDVTVSPLAELVAALHALDDPSHHTGVHDWAGQARASLPPGLAQELQRHAFLWRAVRPSLLLPSRQLSEEESAGPEAELHALRAAAPDDVLTAALAPLRAAPRPGVGRPAGPPSAAARQRARTYARARGPETAAAVGVLLEDPAAFRDHLAEVLDEAWGRCLADRWDRLRPLLAAEARLLADRTAAEGPLVALSAAMPAARVEAGALVIDKLPSARVTCARGLLATPTVHGWPHLTVTLEPDAVVVVQYPLERRASVPRLPQAERRLAALADPQRLRLARSLLREPRSTAELAELHGSSAPAVSRHLRVLREAGLVTTDRSGHFVRYSLDAEAVARLGTDLLEVLLR